LRIFHLRAHSYKTILGGVLLSLGTVFLALPIAYIGYGVWADSRIEELNYSLDRPSKYHVLVERGQTQPSTGNKFGSSILVNQDSENSDSVDTESVIDGNEAKEDGVSSDVDNLDDNVGIDQSNILEISTVQDSPLEPNSPTTSMSASSDAIDSEGEESHMNNQAVNTSLENNTNSTSIDEEAFAATDSEDDIQQVEELHQENSNMLSVESEGTLQSSALPSMHSEDQSNNTNSEPVSNSVTGYAANPDSLDVSVSMDDILELQLESSKFASVSDGIHPARRLLIPSLGVDSGVRDLELVSDGDGLVWENPTRIVGHIPTTARPGARGKGWYFGHLESPVLGGGNVFHRLPEIPSLLQDGETINVVIEAANLRYVYQVYETKWVTEEDLIITDSGLSDITLVTCWPRFHYDKRLLVTAALVDVVPI
jgi:hypothetical protein